MNDIDWHSIRSLKGSQSKRVCEKSCIYIRMEA